MWIGVCPPATRYFLSHSLPCNIDTLKLPCISFIAAMSRLVKDFSPGRLVTSPIPVAASNSVFPAIPAVAAKQVSRMHKMSFSHAERLESTTDHLIVVLLPSDALEKISVSTLIVDEGMRGVKGKNATHRQTLFSFLFCTPWPL